MMRGSVSTTFKFAERYGLIGIFSFVTAYFWFVSDAAAVYGTSGNVKVVLLANTVKVCLAVGFIVPLLAGQFDLSVGHTLALSSVVTAHAYTAWNLPMALAALLGIASATGTGLIIGVLVARFQVNSLIATLGTATILQGVLVRLSAGRIVLLKSDHPLAGWRAFPWPVVFALAVVAAVWYLLEQTPFGRRLHAVGSNPSAANLAGIAVPKLVTLSFVLSGFVAGLAGVLQMVRDSGGNPQNGPGLLLPVLAAAFLGSTVIHRTFNVRGTVVAVVGLAFIVSGLSLNGAATYVEDWFNGGALLTAVALTAYISRLRQRHTAP